MSMIGTTGGVLGSASGAPLSQTSGSSSGGVQKETAAFERLAAAEKEAEQAGGIGQTEEDEETDERDADGRRLWERTKQRAHDAEGSPGSDVVSKDASGLAGNVIDLVG